METDKEMLFLLRQTCHDVQAPLMAMKFTVRNLKGVPREQLELLSDCLGRLRGIFDELAFKKEESVLCSLRKIIESAFAEQRARYPALQFSCSGARIPLYIKKGALERVFSNLLDNAVRAGSQSLVEVSCRQRNGEIEIVIRDDGSGIPPEVLERLNLGKTGMGLAHARAFAREYGGRVSISSKPSEGTRVALTFPEGELLAKYWVVHLEEDEDIRKRWWEQSEAKGISLLSAKSCQEIVDQLENISRHADIYLNDGGEGSTPELAKILGERGFGNIFMLSGNKKNEIFF